MLEDRTLMAIRADTLYTSDDRGRMLQTNEPREQERRQAPRLFVGCTTGGCVVRFGATVPDSTVRKLTRIVEGLPAGDLRLPQAAASLLRGALERDVPVTGEGGGPAYRFPEVFTAPDKATRLTNANRELLRETYPWLYAEFVDWQPCFAVVRDGAAVSICFSARAGALTAEAGVYTLPDFRGRGYAAAVSSAWALAVRGSGRVPLYSTDWKNPASQRVAGRLGLVTFGTDATWV